jgi:hypothetical protein
MIATTPVAPWGGTSAALRAHGVALLWEMGVPPSPAPGLLASAINPVGRDPFSPNLNVGLRTLLEAVRGRDANEAGAAGLQLAGLGAGSTPLGDDYLLGALLGVWALGAAAGLGDAARERWTSALVPADVAGRTSALSASLLDAGARGQAPTPLHDILEPGRPGLGSALGRVTSIGATSGRGCAAAIGATALLLGQAPSAGLRGKTTNEPGGERAG